MNSRLVTITIDCADSGKLADFWTAVFGCDEREEDREGTYIAKSDGGPAMFFQRVPEEKVVKNRVHVDLRPPTTMREEIDRLVVLGAKEVRRVERDEFYWTIMQDPEGNEFCILRCDSERGVTS